VEPAHDYRELINIRALDDGTIKELETSEAQPPEKIPFVLTPTVLYVDFNLRIWPIAGPRIIMALYEAIYLIKPFNSQEISHPADPDPII
jgi:hypothetical protein